MCVCVCVCVCETSCVEVREICLTLQEAAAKKREQNLEEAKLITISEDTSLSPAKKVSCYPFIHTHTHTHTIL